MSILDWFKTNITRANPEVVAAYQTTLPSSIFVNITKDNGVLIAEISKFGDKDVKGLLVTEAKDINTLVKYVNDLVYTKINMPLNVRPYYGDVFKPKDYHQNANRMELVRL